MKRIHNPVAYSATTSSLFKPSSKAISKKRWLKTTILVLMAALLARPLWIHQNIFIGNLYAAIDLLLFNPRSHALCVPVPEKLVAHAGGAVRGLTYTNSREALDIHYASGYRVFEVDFEWTSDSRLVLVHDWKDASERFHVKPHIFTYAEFLQARRHDGLHQLTFEALHRWLLDHPDALIVTDTRASNGRLLAYLEANAIDVAKQFIIQIYRLSELKTSRKIRPRAVWLTAYRYSYPAWALSKVSGVDAFVIPVRYYDRYRRVLLNSAQPFYVHSVAAPLVDKTLRQLTGVYGIYVD